MARSITSALGTALAAQHVIACNLVSLDFGSGFVRLNSSAHDIAWNGYTWIGAAAIGSIDPIRESADLQVHGLSMKLFGVPSELLDIAASEHYQGRETLVYLAAFDAATHALVADPKLVFDGRMDVMRIVAGKTCEITLTAESRLADWDRPRIRRYNHEDQILDYATDLGLEHVPRMVELELKWGYT